MNKVKIIKTGPYLIKSANNYILYRDLNTFSSQLLDDYSYDEIIPDEIIPIKSFDDGFKYIFNIVFQHYEDNMFFFIPIRYKLKENSKMYSVNYLTWKDSKYIVFCDLFLLDENKSISSKTIEFNDIDRICFDTLDKSLYFICNN